MWFDAWWSFALFLGHVVVILVLIPWVLLKRTAHPSAAVAWILTIVFLPYFGGLVALVFGVNRVQRHRPRKQFASSVIAERSPERKLRQVVEVKDAGPLAGHLDGLASSITGRQTTSGNQIELIYDTQESFAAIEQIIREAKRWIHVEFYIWKPDRAGTRIRDLLIQRAREGLTIRFLYDGFGSWGLNRKFLGPMLEAGIHVAFFLPGRTFRERWSINLRNHRKIIVADGQVGFTGGMNIGDEYLGRSPAYGRWRDTQIKFRGPAVLQMQQVFAEDWYYATGEDLTDEVYFPEPEQYGTVRAQVISGGPDTPLPPIYALLFTAIAEARRNITLTTCYFVPPDAVVMALEIAALRGVRVRLLIAGHGNFIWTRLAGRSYYHSLLRSGVEIYEYRKGFLHAKTVTVDGCWSLVGTPNADIRSMMLNFEVALATFDAGVAADLQEQFERDLACAERLDATTWPGRPTRYVLAERFCRLFAPVL
jgi:cardiolipin synthase